MTGDQRQEVYVRPFPGGREADVAAILGLRGHSEFTAPMSALRRERGGYRKEFGFPREDASL